MSTHTPTNAKGIYFITFTCHRWLSLIEKADGYDAVYQFFEVLTGKGHSITGYVIMPNHIHLLLHYSGAGASLNTIMANGKRFMAYDLIRRLKEKGETVLLAQLTADVTEPDRKKGQRHCVWQDSFDVKQCRTENFLLQKLIYIHQNPVSGKWNLAPTAEVYPHSSASFYQCGRQGRFAVVHYEKILDWEHMYD